jgi:hypothetical protein
MIFSVKDFLEVNGIDKKNIHFELFNTSTDKSAMPHRDDSKKQALLKRRNAK